MADTVDNESGRTQTQTNGAVAQQGSRSLQQDALNRVRTLTGGIMIMACPVLLAIAANKVNPQTLRNKLAIGIIWMAALTLEAGICPFVALCLSNATAKICPRISGYLFVASKVLVHICAILLMALAYGILLLISTGNLAYGTLMIFFALFTVFLCYLSVQNNPATATDLTNSQATATAPTNNQTTAATASTNNQATATAPTNNQTTATAPTNNQTTATAPTNNQTTGTASMNIQTTGTGQDTSDGDGDGDGDQQKQVKMLENLVEFSVAGTSILFLGLEGLALERLSRYATATPTPTQPDQGLLVLSFFTCLLGVLVMLLGVVPPPQRMTGVKDESATIFIERLNIVLAMFIVMTVILIASETVKLLAGLVVVPALVSFLVWMIIEISDDERIRREVKPASLDLTKVTFTGFLAVSVMAIGNGPVSLYEKAFILLTSAAVVAGIGWRLLTHRTDQSRAIVVAANAASVCAHACVALAVVPFAVMAFKRGGASAGAAGPATPR